MPRETLATPQIRTGRRSAGTPPAHAAAFTARRFDVLQAPGASARRRKRTGATSSNRRVFGTESASCVCVNVEPGDRSRRARCPLPRASLGPRAPSREQPVEKLLSSARRGPTLEPNEVFVDVLIPTTPPPARRSAYRELTSAASFVGARVVRVYRSRGKAASCTARRPRDGRAASGGEAEKNARGQKLTPGARAVGEEARRRRARPRTLGPVVKALVARALLAAAGHGGEAVAATRASVPRTCGPKGHVRVPPRRRRRPVETETAVWW